MEPELDVSARSHNTRDDRAERGRSRMSGHSFI